MNKVLKNYSRERLNVNFRGRNRYFGPKEAKTFNMEDEEEKALYFFWKERYEFLGDITSKVVKEL